MQDMLSHFICMEQMLMSVLRHMSMNIVWKCQSQAFLAAGLHSLAGVTSHVVIHI